jgi:hypothetical protein
MKITQAWHTAQVVALMNGARGDLMLDHNGDLFTRDTWCAETYKELPYAQHTPRECVARVSRDGWTLTADGAEFILQNLPPERKVDAVKLRAVALRPGPVAVRHRPGPDGGAVGP